VGLGPELTRRRLLALLGLALTGCTPARAQPTATPPPFVGPDVAAIEIGQDVRVRMQVQCADFGGPRTPTYLRPTCYYEGFFFRLVIPADRRDQFQKAVGGPPEIALVEKIVDARGPVQKNGSWSEIVLLGTDQLKVATGWSVPKVPTRVPTPIPPSPTERGSG
jgi:hypothetical protein